MARRRTEDALAYDDDADIASQLGAQATLSGPGSERRQPGTAVTGQRRQELGGQGSGLIRRACWPRGGRVSGHVRRPRAGQPCQREPGRWCSRPTRSART